MNIYSCCNTLLLIQAASLIQTRLSARETNVLLTPTFKSYVLRSILGSSATAKRWPCGGGEDDEKMDLNRRR
jgi:hypothetical protein